MRSDFGRVVIERPRRGSGNRSAKARWYGKLYEDEEGNLEYDGMTRLPSSFRQHSYFPKIGDKSFSDVLGPIKGYLHKCCGRLWDDVYSELCASLGRFSWPLRHILTQHVDVASKTYRGIDGNIWELNKRGPSIVNGGYGQEFYVEPETKLLRAQPKKRWRYRPEKKPIDKIPINEHFAYERVAILKSICGCSSFSPKQTPGAPEIVWRRRSKPEGPAICQHGNEPLKRPLIWYVVEYGYHSPDDIYDKITVSGVEVVRYYRDFQDKLTQPFEVRRKVVNKKDLRRIRAFLRNA